MKKGTRHVLLDSTPGDTGTGAAAPAPAPAAGEAAATPAAAPAPAPAGSGEGTPGGDGAGPAGSALAAGKGAEGAAGADGDGGTGSGVAAIPEKFIVKNEKGEVDQAASAAKVADAYAKLEKKLGEGNRPKTAADYKMPELPEALKDAKLDTAMNEQFRAEAHRAGLSQSQFEFVMGKYLDLAPQLVDGAASLKAEDAVAELKTAWGKDYQANAANAWRGMTQIAQVAGLTVDQVEAELGNSPAFNRIMAAVGAQMREDQSINTSGQGAGTSNIADAAALQSSPAFRDTKHPEHAQTVAKWNSIVTKGVADTPLL
jgi:hypothetical protein